MALNLNIISKFNDKGLKEAESSFGAFGKTAAAIAVAATTAVAAIAAKSIKAFGDFDSKLNQSVAIMGNVSDAMRNDMAAAARQVAKETTFSADQAAESFFFLASAGLDATQSIKAMPQVAKFAQAGMFDMALATDLLTDAQSALGMVIKTDANANLKEMTRLSDVLVRANTLANASVEQFSLALTTKAGASLRQFGKDAEEGVAVLAALADQGIKGEIAGTNLSIAIRDLTSKALKNKDAFKSFGVSVFDSSGNMRNMADIIGDLEKATNGMSDAQKKATFTQLGFSDKSMGTISALLGTSDAIRNYESELRSASGFTEDVAGKQLETFNAQVELLKSRVQDVAIGIGGVLVPSLMKAMDSLGPLIDAAGVELVKAFESLVPILELLLKSLPTLLPIVTKLIELFVKIATPIFDLAARVLPVFLTYLDRVIDLVGSLIDPVRLLGAEFVYIVSELAIKLLNEVPKIISAILSMLPDVLSAGLKVFNSLIDAVLKIIPPLLRAIVDAFPQVIKTILKALPDILDAGIKLFTALVEALPKIIPPLLKAFVDLLPVIIKAVIDMLPALIDAGVKLFIALVQAVPKIIPQLITAIMDLIPVIVDTLLDAIPQLIDAGFQILKGLAKGIIDNAPKILGEAAKNMGDTLVNSVKALLGIKSPSKVFFDLGLDVGAGFVNGMKATFKEIEKTALELAQAAADKAQEALNKAGITDIYSNYGVAQNIATRTGQIFDVGRATDDLNAIYDYMGARTREQMLEVERFVLGMTFQEALDTLFVGVNDGTEALTESIEKVLESFSNLSRGVQEAGILPDEVNPFNNRWLETGDITGGGSPHQLMATGGFVQKPINAIIGEAGPEVVMPLDRFENLLGVGNGRAGGSTYNITINAGVGSDPVSIGRYVTDAIKRYESVSGKVFASA